MAAAAPIRLGVVGIGKIARDQHLPAIAADPRFALVATASRHAQLDGVPGYPDVAAMLAGGHALDAVSLCTPPAGRYAQARAAIDAGLAVMLEKPPAATLGEIAALRAHAAAAGTVLYASWHSRAAAGVAPARAWLADKRLDAVRIDWREDIRRWHPGQDWILAAGGFGVFDPGINALSILTHILPVPVILDAARLAVPANRAAPIRAALTLRAGTAPVAATFDFLQTGPQTWDIAVDTDAGTLRLEAGGSRLVLPGAAGHDAPNAEYSSLYAHFAGLIGRHQSDVDITPLRLVADAFMLGERETVDAFEF